MFPPHSLLRKQLRQIVADKRAQGHDVDSIEERLKEVGDSYDALNELAVALARAPHVASATEPDTLAAIWDECDPRRPLAALATVDLDDSAQRVEQAFLGSVCGCMLGKPIEIEPTLAMLRAATEPLGEWPLRYYVTERIAAYLGRPLHPRWWEAVRERIRYVAPDDDINYTIVGMMLLEAHGLTFTKLDVRDAWLRHLPIGSTFGPERTVLLKAGLHSLEGGVPDDVETWAAFLNPGDEWCGGLIRADAYGYACPARPALAAELAWRDASFTHRRTGVYAAMFVAAAIATAQVVDDRLAVMETALQFVPTRSRFFRTVRHCIDEVWAADDWLDGYARIHAAYGQHGHCQVYQEMGTLVNTFRFARDVSHGICIQVSQGNDTDSFGATAGSLLGAYFAPGSLDPSWLAPFNDEIRTGMGRFYERSLSRLARRMGHLPRVVADELPA